MQTMSPAALAPGTSLYFSRTGQTVSGPFLAYWLKHRAIGMPVGPYVQHGLHLTQWFEFARLELRYVPFDSATDADVFPVELGWEFARHVGYAERLDAFQPKPGGPDRFFPDTGHSIQNGFKQAYERPGIPEQMGPPISDEFMTGPTTYQFFRYEAFSWDTARGVQRVSLGTLDAGINGRLGMPQPRPEGALDVDSLDMMALSDMLTGERWIEIDLSDYELTAWVGDYEVLRSTVITGSPYSPTVTGQFSIYIKNRVQDLSGIGWDGNPYSEDGVPWVMYFWEDYAIHGTTWRSSYGYADSQGCVIPPNEVGAQLFAWASYGTRVWVHD